MREPKKATALIVFVLLAIQWPNAVELQCQVQSIALAMPVSTMS